jgi:DNA helicase-2/ATP-dependent DNA helicase PcrA
MADISMLNSQQREAVVNSYGSNTVLIAGAGSGKTATLKTRTAYLIDDLGVDPSSIMVVTFTNKAAGEIKHRISQITPDANRMWLGTFHSICVRILRQFGPQMGIKGFTIMDTYDAKSVLKEVLADRNIGTDKYLVNQYMSKISDRKSNLVRPQDCINSAQNSTVLQFAHVYQDYQNITWKRKSFDFDDLIIYAILLLSSSMSIATWFHDNIKYIMVDESQDTNTAQFQFIKLLAGANNLLLVGDDDQSIYSFRNAKPEYLLNFQKTYPDAKILKLEQNYRSTKTIIEASNAVVKHNKVRNDKTMFCDNAKGDPIIYHNCRNSADEGNWVATEIKIINSQGVDYKDVAILYRTNSQSRALEEELMKMGVPFKLVGSLGFYDRKEIKDMLAYCRLSANHSDEISFRRVLSLQKGVGKKSVDDIITFCNTMGTDYLDSLGQYMAPKRIQVTLNALTYLYHCAPTKPSEFLEHVLTTTGYKQELINEKTPEAQARLENLNELLSIAKEHESQDANITIDEFINKVSLASDPVDRAQEDAITMMTSHSAKGLEFKYVFVVGVEEKLLPHQNSLSHEPSIEEERRLMYVAMTRAKEQLYLLNAKERRDYSGNVNYNSRSRFLDEIPAHCICTV